MGNRERNGMTEEELLLIPEINNTFEIFATAVESIEQNPERSLKIITSCIDKFQVYQAYTLVSLCKSFLAKCERVMGNYDIAESYCEQGYSLAKSFDFDKGKLFNIIEWSVIKYCRHQLDESTRMSKEAQSLAQKITDRIF